MSGLIWQTASADVGNASVSLINGGTINAQMLAVASATAGGAVATASVDTGIGQFATALAAVGTAVIANDGTMTSAPRQMRMARHPLPPSAGLTRRFAVRDAGTASATLTNSGAISVNAAAAASATTGLAAATAQVDDGIIQQAIGSTVTLDNSGSIDMSAIADATGVGAYASATMDGISQSASGATALAEFTNSGTVDLWVAPAPSEKRERLGSLPYLRASTRMPLRLSARLRPVSSIVARWK